MAMLVVKITSASGQNPASSNCSTPLAIVCACGVPSWKSMLIGK
jgi:hypothetical protein